jgi:hypothetical protein
MSSRKGRFGSPDSMPQIITRIQWHPEISRDELDKQITEQLMEIWGGQLSRKERQHATQTGRGAATEIANGMFSKFDAVILKQAETLGWRLLVSSAVQERMSEWWIQESNGPEMFERLGKALAKSARIVQKRELPPIDDPDLVAGQKQMIRELRVVFREMKKMFSQRHADPTEDKVVECFIRIVSDSGASYGLLRANLDQWRKFFEDEPTLLKVRALGPRPSPATLFLDWLKWCKGHKTETIRKTISALRNSLKKK